MFDDLGWIDVAIGNMYVYIFVTVIVVEFQRYNCCQNISTDGRYV